MRQAEHNFMRQYSLRNRTSLDKERLFGNVFREVEKVKSWEKISEHRYKTTISVTNDEGKRTDLPILLYAETKGGGKGVCLHLGKIGVESPCKNDYHPQVRDLARSLGMDKDLPPGFVDLFLNRK